MDDAYLAIASGSLNILTQGSVKLFTYQFRVHTPAEGSSQLKRVLGEASRGEGSQRERPCPAPSEGAACAGPHKRQRHKGRQGGDTVVQEWSTAPVPEIVVLEDSQEVMLTPALTRR